MTTRGVVLGCLTAAVLVAGPGCNKTEKSTTSAAVYQGPPQWTSKPNAFDGGQGGYCIGSACTTSLFSKSWINVSEDYSRGRRTGFALANPGSSAVTVELEFVSSTGDRTFNRATISLPAGASYAKHIDELQLPHGANFSGTANIHVLPSGAGPLPEVLGLWTQTNDGVNYTAAQAITESAPIEKRTRFEYRVSARNTFTPFGYLVRDFAGAMVNPNPQPLYVQVTLVSDDANYVFPANSACPNARRVCTGGYYGPRYIAGYTKTERNVGTNWNFVNVAFPKIEDMTQFYWTGKVIIESVALNGVPARPFYSFDPAHFSVEATDTTPARAYHRAWAVTGWDVPAHWDEDLKQFVAPYSNFWHNWDEWMEGWDTQVTLVNRGPAAVSFSVDNHTYSGGAGTGASPCPPGAWDGRAFNIDVLNNLYSVNSASTRSFDLFRTKLPDADRAAHSIESVLFIDAGVTSPKNLDVKVRVRPGLPGTSYRCDGGAPSFSRILSSPSSVAFNAPIPLTGSAVDNAGIARIAFLVDGALVANLNNGAPYPAERFNWSYSLTGVGSGSHVITAVAFDLAGNSLSSSGVIVTVGPAPPSCNLALSNNTVSNRANGSGVPTSITYTRSGVAGRFFWGNNGGNPNVQVVPDNAYVEDPAQANVGNYPLDYTNLGAAAGTYLIAARVLMANGQVVQCTITPSATVVIVAAP